MIEALFVRTKHGLEAADAASEEQIDSIPLGATVKAKITQGRSLPHHRWFFALIQVVFKHQTLYPTIEHLLDAIKIAVGHCDVWTMKGGREIVRPRSISFAKMDETAFKQFKERVVELVVTKIVPKLDREALDHEIEEMLK